jgi:hypothetical protein
MQIHRKMLYLELRRHLGNYSQTGTAAAPNPKAPEFAGGCLARVTRAGDNPTVDRQACLSKPKVLL